MLAQTSLLPRSLQPHELEYLIGLSSSSWDNHLLTAPELVHALQRSSLKLGMCLALLLPGILAGVSDLSLMMSKYVLATLMDG